MEIGYYDFLGNTCYFDGSIMKDLDSLETWNEIELFSMSIMFDYIGKEL